MHANPRNLLLSLLFTLLAAPGPFSPVGTAHAEGAARTYALRGSLYIQVYKDPTTLAQALAHDHVVQASGWLGSATFDPENPAACKVTITVPVQKLIVDEKGIRTQLGYETFPSDGDREDIKKSMLAEDQLNGAKYTEIKYESTTCAPQGEGMVVTGNMTIRGVTKPVTMNMAMKADSVNFSAKGATKIRATQFGFQPYSTGFGALKNQDQMILVVDVTGAPR